MTIEHLRQPAGSGPLGGLLLIRAYNEAQPSPILARAIGGRLVRVESLVERPLTRPEWDALKLGGSLPGPELQAWITDALSRIKAIKPTAIVTLGEDVFQLLTGRYDARLADVHAYCFSLDVPHSGTFPLIPTFAPAQIFFQPDYQHWLHFAIAKASRFTATDPPIATRINPSCQEVISYLNQAQSASQVSIDIECIRETCELTAIAVATSPTEVMSIPFAKQFMEPCWTLEEEANIWKTLAALLAAPVAKVFQNAMFDVMILEHFGLRVNGLIEDTLWIANLLNPELPKGLKDLGRQYLHCEPWKTQKDFTLSGDPLAFWQYNALDAARTFQIYHAQKAELKTRSLETFYASYIKPLLNPALDTCRQGIAVDLPLYASFKETIESLCVPLRASLCALSEPLISGVAKRTRKRNKAKDVRGPSPKTGKEIVLTKGYDETAEPFNPASPAQVKLVLKTLGYRIPTKDGSETTDHTALLKLNRKRPHPFIESLVRFKKLEKLRSSYLSIPFEPDSRCRFTYNRARDNDNNLGTKSGRFGCSATPWGTGLNIQTIPRKDPRIPVSLRDIFIPDAGEQFIEVDLSQAELRVVAWLSGDPALCRLLDNNEDVHQYVADRVKELTRFDCPRQLGKRINHASNYSMGAAKFADSCLVEADMAISVEQARQLLLARSQAFPLITTWQDSIANLVRTTRRLISPHGRERYFYGQYDDNMHREALSFIPQATVVDCLNGAWIALATSPDYGVNFSVRAQVHDSLLLSVKPDFAPKLLALINDTFGAQSIIIRGLRRVIPWDIKSGAPGEPWGRLKAL